MTVNFCPEHAQKRGYTRGDWDAVEAPELTSKELANPTKFESVSPILARKFKEEIKRGRW